MIEKRVWMRTLRQGIKAARQACNETCDATCREHKDKNKDKIKESKHAQAGSNTNTVTSALRDRHTRYFVLVFQRSKSLLVEKAHLQVV